MVSLNARTQTGYTESDDVTAKDSFLKNPDLMAMTFSHLPRKRQCLLNAALTCKDFLEVALDALWEELDSLVPLLKLLPALQVEDEAYILDGDVSQADWDRLQYYSRKVKFFITIFNTDDHKVHPSTYLRIAQLQSSALLPSLRHLHYSLDDRSTPHIFLFLSPLLNLLALENIRGFENTIVGPFLATLSSRSPMLNRIFLRSGRLPADILKKYIVHFKQLRSLELSDAVVMNDFSLWEVLGTLPSLAILILTIDPPAHAAPKNPNSQSGCRKYFEALESLCVTGTFFLIQSFLGFIDSPCLKSIKVYPVINRARNEHEHEDEDLFTPSMMVVSSKWSQSLENLVIGSNRSGIEHRILNSKCLMLLTDLHEMQTFHLIGWRMENMEDDVRRLVMSWPKLRTLRVLPLNDHQTFITLSLLRIIAETCPELRYLHINLDTSTIPPFDSSSKSLHHNLEILTVGAHTSNTITETTLQSQIQVARYLDLIFPYLKGLEKRQMNVFWSGIRDLVELCQPDESNTSPKDRSVGKIKKNLR